MREGWCSCFLLGRAGVCREDFARLISWLELSVCVEWKCYQPIAKFPRTVFNHLNNYESLLCDTFPVEKMNKYLLAPYRQLITDWSIIWWTNEFIGVACRGIGEKLVREAGTVQRHLHYSKPHSTLDAGSLQGSSPWASCTISRNWTSGRLSSLSHCLQFLSFMEEAHGS